ncbi:prepilin-type N-terminal cleavage/methylation domain-containing protein [Vibrio fluvialis]|uniref:type IV pilus modification PilV family protein n=1 Tax=Vibrio fluvialis TaxID=676 RepID=UPI00057020B3|nr:prepilin-type N-terminal cleavage/methylation domain-containing protein [Vibrio fluvialis]EKO3469275.1 prepilin-type N-terminal cleavage/methylation domain-containing protein [Vibrio fluvialis]MBL4262410.1 prepilin-type N-terminal cleavage/methylation domain-containing protein [Vibrio fluvialis]MBY7805194.1 prepilin-type N-terminal cleavage/methylation domain-containing protein [Vibrio fluvialis]MBY7873222.1 prepilin-type N-terminal cleavage/methylation domain-containing protein [Vibrio fluv
MTRGRGFTLIESIVAMVLIGLGMLMLTSFLYPQIERSATPHYQTRAAELGQSLMSQILARGFDHYSDFDGGAQRCGELGSTCTTSDKLGAETGETSPAQFNDVDDYSGCWYGGSAADCGSITPTYPLSNILGANVATDYHHFTVLIRITYVNDAFQSVAVITPMKRVELVIDTGRYGRYTFVAYRGNY